MMELVSASLYLILAISILLTSNTTIVTAFNATKVVSDSQVDHQQLLVVNSVSDHDDCPPWFEFHGETQSCRCLSFYAAKCFDNKAYLSAGYCATYDEDTEILSLSSCPYHGFTLSRHDRYWYIQLPENVSKLNDYMCGSLNRKGRVCSECRNGYGLSITSVGFQYFECSNCTGTWYGVPLFLFLEFFPLTVFYLVILIFQINVTSGSITCFIMYSQLFVIAFDRTFAGDDPGVRDVVTASSKHSQLLFLVLMTIFDVWNLRFFRNVLPSFCISTVLKPIHIIFLDYISVFYPLCLIFLTWICVELYGRKYRLLIWLWRPFHRCFAGEQCAIDFINVFASFFLLSFTKVMYQAVLLLVQRKIVNKQFEDIHYSNFVGFTYVVGVDYNVIYGSTEHLLFVIPATIFFFIFSILPVMLLIFYPFRFSQALFSKCGLYGIVMNTFVEKFYSSYRTGLDGGRDMRSFAGLYFVVRFLLFLSNMIAGMLMVSNNDPHFIRSIIFVIAALLMALCRPYKEAYMNVLDTLMLAQLGLQCHLVSAEGGFSIQRNLAITFEVMTVLPLACYLLFFIAKAMRLQKHLMKAFKEVSQKCSKLWKTVLQGGGLTFNTPSTEQILIEPTSAGNNYGSSGYTAQVNNYRVCM